MLLFVLVPIKWGELQKTGVNFSKNFNVEPEISIKPKSAVPPQHPPAKQATDRPRKSQLTSSGS
jgi:hypothetical protein